MNPNIRESEDHTVYEPFDDASKQIRLATIQPGQADEQVACTLQTYYLDAAPEYKALSYCWDDETNTVPIKLQQHEWHVTTNRYAAIKAFRQEGEPVALWVDAVCINQHDNDEKSRQIPLMGTIFQSAVGVIAWLGDGDAKVLAEVSRTISKVVDLVACTRKGEASREERDYLRSILYDQQRWKPVFKIFRKPYWTRLWIIQEICLAKDLEFVCGVARISQEDMLSFRFALIYLAEYGADHELDLDTGHAVIRGLVNVCWGKPMANIELAANMQDDIKSRKSDSKGKRESADHIENLSDSQVSDTSHLVETRVRCHRRPRDWASFASLLHRARSSLCKDPRDRIYALLGLTAFSAEDAELSIVPDYSKSVLDVYRDFALAYIAHTKGFKVLKWAGLERRSNKDITLSWVPDFTFQYSRSTHTILPFPSGTCRAWKPDFSVSASGQLLTNAAFCSSIKSECKIQGYFRQMASLDSMYENLIENVINAMECLTESLQDTPISQAKTVNFSLKGIDIEMLFYLLISRKCYTKKPKDATSGVGFYLILGAFAEKRFGEATPQGFDRTNYLDCYLIWNENDHGLISASDNDKWKAFERALPDSWQADVWPEIGGYIPQECVKEFLRSNTISLPGSYTFFQTEDGYFGYSGSSVKCEDEVWLLPGCRWPLVLRHAGDAYQLVDHCFAHGMMKGEMVKRYEEGTLPARNIAIG